MNIPNKKTRADRKKSQKQAIAEREEYERQHPIISGTAKLVNYVPPRWKYNDFSNVL